MTRKRLLLGLAGVAVLAGGGLVVAQDGPAPSRARRSVDDYPKYEEVVGEGFETLSGFFTVHRNKNRVFLEVPEQQQGRVFLLATSVSGGSTLAGHQVSDMPAVFDRVDRKMLLLEKEVHWKAEDRKPLAEVVKRTYSDQVRRVTNVVTQKGSSAVIDLVDLLGAGAPAFFGRFGAALDASVIRVTKLKVFPKNVEFEVQMPARGSGQMTTIAYSLSALPDPRMDDYRPRNADDRIGYFLTAFKDFSDDKAAGDRFVRLVNRWDLRKADPTLAVSPPKKPIVFYVEKSVPYRFRKAVHEGILEWNKAYEKCGFSQAITVRQQTEDNEFKDFDPEDVRYNFFRWIASEKAFAKGPSRVNPYTGEILDADIVFDDSMARFYLRDYDMRVRTGPAKLFTERLQRLMAEHPERYPFAQGATESTFERELAMLPNQDRNALCSFGDGLTHELAFASLAALLEAGPGATLPPGPKKEFPEDFIFQVIKDTVMHEVGHTLGLRHNFKASTWKPLGELNQNPAPEAISGSVMDYNALNVRASKDVPQGKFAPATIGPYDYWAIEYGYKDGASPEDLKKIASRVEESGLAYATDEDTTGPDPYVNRWDLGADPLEYAQHRVKVAQTLWKDIVERVVASGEGYQDARRAFDMVLHDYQQSGLFASRFVGGEHVRRDHRGDPNEKDPVEVVAAKKQREAVAFVCANIFADANFKFPPELIRKLAAGRWSHWGSEDWRADLSYPIHDRVLGVQQWALFQLTNPETLERLIAAETKVAETDEVFGVAELFETLDKEIFSEIDTQEAGPWTTRKPLISTVRRNLQRSYAKVLMDIAIEKDGPTPPTARTLVWHRLKGLAARLKTAAAKPGIDAYSAAHLDEIRTRIEKALEASFTLNPAVLRTTIDLGGGVHGAGDSPVAPEQPRD